MSHKRIFETITTRTQKARKLRSRNRARKQRLITSVRKGSDTFEVWAISLDTRGSQPSIKTLTSNAMPLKQPAASECSQTKRPARSTTAKNWPRSSTSCAPVTRSSCGDSTGSAVHSAISSKLSRRSRNARSGSGHSRRTSTPRPLGGKLVFHLFGSLAEFERDLILDRTMAKTHCRTSPRTGRWPTASAHTGQAHRCSADARQPPTHHGSHRRSSWRQPSNPLPSPCRTFTT